MNRIAYALTSIALFGISCLSAAPANADPLEMMADIREPIETEFGQYVPQLVDAVPSVAPYEIADDFSNVANFDQFKFSDEQKALLLQNGFVAAPSGRKEMFEIYTDAQEKNLPVFVTVDALLHAFHEQFDHILRTLESDRFFQELCDLTEALLNASATQAERVTDPRALDAAQRNAAFFAVAAKLLGLEVTVPEASLSWVETELSRIEAQDEIAGSSLFGYSEDYTQYIPRGHYTYSETLTKYFQAMMWYGRLTFHNSENELLKITQEMAERQTIQALLIVQLMNSIEANSEDPLVRWNRIYRPTTFLVGKADDLTVFDYTPAAKAVYGADFASLTVDAFADPGKLDEFMNYPIRPASQISPQIWGSGFRYMGQRFIPDSYIFNTLFFGGGIPSGLDVMAVYGSTLAREILERKEMYGPKHNELIAEFAAMDESVWVESVFWNWLYSLMPVFADKGEGFPTFMQNPAWRDKDLACALGSWAELRHDTILYAKQSYATGIPDGSQSYATEYVEPNPWAFARLSSMCQLMKNGLENQQILSERADSNLSLLNQLLQNLTAIAENELAQKPLTIGERRFIRSIGGSLTTLSVIDNENTDRPGDWIEDDMAIIADVHTDPGMQQCLEVATGHPLTLYVLIGDSNALSVAVGASYSYYEFAQPIAERLNDETWRQWLDKGQNPPSPDWITSYIGGQNGVSVDAAKHENGPIWGSQELYLPTKAIRAGESVVVSMAFSPNRPGDAMPQVDNLTLYAQVVVNGFLIDVQLERDLTSSISPYTYRTILDTTDWPEGNYTISVYCPTNVAINQSGGVTVENDPSSIYDWMEY